MNRFLLLTLLPLLFSCKQKENTTIDTSLIATDSLTIQLQQIQSKNILPGFAVSIFTKDSILYQKGFGYSDIKEQKPYTVDQVQIIASITKTLVGVSLMKAVEDGLLHLDDPINEILPFKVYNPHFPDNPITIRHLATHTSTITGTKKSDKGYRFKSPLLKEKFPEAHHPLLNNYNKTDEISMSDFLRFKLDPQGKWYEETLFIKNRPGTAYEYSNLGITLLAHIIELKTGTPFNNYTKELILDPLTMHASTWSLDNVSKSTSVIYYNEIYQEVPPYHIISYPDGGLYSSVSDMTLYLQEMIKGYQGEGRILQPSSYQEMMHKQFEGEELTEGLCWDLSITPLIGHSGNDFGTSTLMYFSPNTGIGRILFSNISIEKEEQEDIFYGIYNLLFEHNFNL